MESIALLPPEYEAELITLAEQGDPCALGIKQLRDTIDVLRQELEAREVSSGAVISQASLPMTSRLVAVGGIGDISLAASSSENLMLLRAVLLHRAARGLLFASMDDTLSSSTHVPSSMPQEHGLFSEQENENISQEPPIAEKETLHQESLAEEDPQDEEHPYQGTQLVCASIFLLCASTIPAWLTLGIQLISPLVAIIGMLGAATAYAMSWSAGRALKREDTSERE